MQDFKQQLEYQLDFIRSSLAAFDEGREHEAKRLAVHIRNIVHDGKGRTTSLLTHLDAKDKLGYVDIGAPDPLSLPVIVLSFGVAVLEMTLSPEGGDVRYVPAFSQPDTMREHPTTSFGDWWELPILRDQRGNVFSRSDLVLSVSDQDGGAHIDATLNAAYAARSRDNSIGFTQGENKPISNSIVEVSLRHIAEELLRAIDNGITWNGDVAEVPAPVCPLPLNPPPSGSRNGPCPCGSGRKLKRCYGLRRPRRRMEHPSKEPAERVSPSPAEASREVGPPKLYFDSFLLVPVDA